MQTRKEIVEALKESETGPVLSLPCEKIKDLLNIIEKEFFHIPLTREEEGVGISAGATLAGKRPALFVQSSGMGNMFNALLSLTKTFSLPLSIFVSWRGVYKERIQAQVPMGRSLPGMLEACGIGYTVLEKREDLTQVKERLKDIFKKNYIHVFLMSPALWESPEDEEMPQDSMQSAIQGAKFRVLNSARAFRGASLKKTINPSDTRFDYIKVIASYVKEEVIVSNLGIPSKELFYIRHRPLNFYMLGSMGMATPLGLGISLFTKKKVIVIDGDGSLLMNPGTLGTVAYLRPENLIIIAIDNGSYGSTGNQPTLTSKTSDLELIARGFGIQKTVKVSSTGDLRKVIEKIKKGPFFVHALARPGNREVPDIPLTPLEIKEQFSNALQRGEPLL